MDDFRAFITTCVRGDPAARALFQNLYGPSIYTYPVRGRHFSRQDAGDFYQYAFAQDRLFKRVASWKGIDEQHFKGYLIGVVLPDLFLEWLRTLRQLATVPLDDGLPDLTLDPQRLAMASERSRGLAQAFRQLDPKSRVTLKLLALAYIDLEPDDVLWLAQHTARGFLETLERLDAVRDTLLTAATRVQSLVDKLHEIFSRIYEYQDRLARLEEKITRQSQQGGTTTGHTFHVLSQEKKELERLLAWRFEQQTRLRQHLQRLSPKPSGQAMADLLQIPLGSVHREIHRARQALRELLDELDSE